MVMLHSCGRFAKCISVFKIGLLALFMLPASLCGQQTIHVPADQPTIQAGINAASNGDTVLVSPGTYIENINFNGKAITVTSSGGPSGTIIDGNANDAVVIFANSETANSVLNGFTIRNGLSQFSAPTQGSGGGIYITNASPTISGNVITNNQAVEGAGISVQFASPIIKGNTITLNHQCCGSGGTGGGGILIGGAGSAQILNNTITNNALSSAEGGGISLFAAGTPIIRGNLISGNSVSGLIPAATGGGIWIANQSDALILDNLIVGNSADQGAGISSNGSPNLLLMNNTIVYNNARLSVGSGVLAEGFTTLINNIIVGMINQSVVDCGQFSPNPPSVFQFNDVFSPQSNNLYGSCANETGKNGNLSSDPLFMSAANGDFHLRLGSSAIDASDNTTPNLPATDFDGNPRIVDGNNDGVAIVDLGAYEVGNTSAAAISPSSLVFSPQPVGVTSNPQPVTLNSTGATPFQITSIQTSGDFMQSTTCPVITSPGSAPGVPNGSSCGFNVSFTPATNGPRAGLLTVNGTNGTSLQVSLSGTGFTPAPVLSLSTTSLTFSPRLVGTTSAQQPVTLANTGNTSLSISSIAATQPFAQTNNCSAVLAPAANCTINVTFQPIVSGNATGTLTIVDNASGSPHTVSLTGMGNPVPQPVAVTLVQHASKDAGTATSSSLAFPSNNTVGNWIAVAIRAGHSGQSFTVRDSNGNTYHQAIQFNVTTDAPNGDTLGIFYAENIASGANQVTVSDTISGTMRIAVLEYSGVASTNSLDATAAAQGSSSAPNSGSVTTSANGDLLLGAVLTGNGENFTAGTGYLIEERVPAEPGTKLIVEDQVQPASGTASANVSLGAADSWGAAIAAFKSATTSVSTSPTITSLTPNSGGIGTSITITGTNFGSTQGTSSVTFNGTPATPTSWSATSIVAPMPVGATTGNVVVTVGGVSSNGASFTVMVATSITSLNPLSGPIGSLIAIAGTNFGTTQGTSTVAFNGASAGAASSWSATSIGVLVPAAATTGNVVVIVGGVASNGLTFTIGPDVTPPTAPTNLVAGASPSLGIQLSWTPSTDNVAVANYLVEQCQGAGCANFTQNPPLPGNITPFVSIGPLTPATSYSFRIRAKDAAGNLSGYSNVASATTYPLGITGMSPNSGVVGTPVTIFGGGFGASQGTSTVTFNGTAGIPTVWSDTSIAVPVPSGATSGSVLVTVGAGASNGLPFSVIPNISSLSPTSGPAGSTVTITGSGFGFAQGTSTVTFNGISAGVANSWGATSIVLSVPAGATAGNVIVTVGGVPSNGVAFTATPPPAITSLSLASGPVGTPITIAGANFGVSQGTSTVTFNGTLATQTSWSTTSISVPVPAGATRGNVVVTVSGVASNGISFMVTPPPPSITALSPSFGPVGISVTISGTNFGASQGTSTVTFNGTAVTLAGWTDTSISVSVPSGATTGNVVVTVSAVASNGVLFTVTLPPTITSLSPASGPVGTSVIISGANFGASQGTSAVTYNGTTITPTSWSPTSIVAPVPAGATTGNFVVIVSGVASNGVTFTIPPSITSLTPTSGGVLNYVTISGANFGSSRGSSTVTFNGTPDNPNFSSWNSVSITTLLPAGATTGNVVVTVGGQPSNGVLFTVTKPTPSIASLNPRSGLVGTPVTITGANFAAIQDTSTVTFNGTLATPSSWSTGSITVSVPSGATTGNVVVTVGGVASNGVAFNVNSAAPSIALVQHISKDAGTTSSSPLAFNANNTAGNFIAVVIRAGKSGQAFSVSDSRGNVYKQAIRFDMTVDAETLGIFYAENIAGGANTITVSNTILGTMRFAVLEYSGVATSNSLDVSAVAEGTSASPATSTVTTNFSGDLLLGEIVTANPASFNSGSGYTIEERVPVEPNTKLIVEEQRQSIAGAASAGASLGASDGWGAVLVAFRHP